MSSFTTPLHLEPLPDGRRFKLLEEFEYHVGNKESIKVICVPAGFITDFASVPRIFWSIIPPWGKYGKAAVIHDWLYYINKKYNKEKADKIFLEAMGVLSVPSWKKYIMYMAVRVGGHNAWRQHRERDFRIGND